MKRLRMVALVLFACVVVGSFVLSVLTLQKDPAVREYFPTSATITETVVEGDVVRLAADLGRHVYRHSVVPGGVYSAEELAQAIERDPVVAAHYVGLDPSRMRVERLREPLLAHLSYRIGDKVYWTGNKVLLAAGEEVLTDGETTVRARCGNNISIAPLGPSSPNEPDDDEFAELEDDGDLGEPTVLAALPPTGGQGLPLAVPPTGGGAGGPGNSARPSGAGWGPLLLPFGGGGGGGTSNPGSDNSNPAGTPSNTPGGSPGGPPGGGNPGDPPGGSNPGDPPGNNPGDPPGGENPSDPPGGGNPGDPPGGGNPGDPPGGGNPGNPPGGDDPGDPPGGGGNPVVLPPGGGGTTPISVPEPSTLLLLSIGAAGTLLGRMRRRRK